MTSGSHHMSLPLSLPQHVSLVEVGPRDGLQNESRPIRIEDKVRLVNDLTAAGLGHIEVGSFVSPKWVPQMAGSAQVFEQIQRREGVIYSALAPNLRGFEDALAAGVREVAVFAAASEAFSQRNLNCSISESLESIHERGHTLSQCLHLRRIRKIHEQLPFRSGRRCDEEMLENGPVFI